MREICETLGFNKSTFYYQPKIDASEDALRTEIQRLAAAYPTYGYRRITKMLAAEGHTVGYKHVARLMKERKKKFISTTLRTSTKREIASGILSHRCIIRNARIRR